MWTLCILGDTGTRHASPARVTLCTMSSCVPSGSVLPSSCIRGMKEKPNSFFSPFSLAMGKHKDGNDLLAHVSTWGHGFGDTGLEKVLIRRPAHTRGCPLHQRSSVYSGPATPIPAPSAAISTP